MSLSNNLLYLLLLYAVLDNDNRLSTTTGILLALGIMLFGCCNRAINACCGNGCDNNFRTSATIPDGKQHNLNRRRPPPFQRRKTGASAPTVYFNANGFAAGYLLFCAGVI